MPRGDGTGPAGAGPMSGRGAGFCAGFTVPGYADTTPGRGFGRGRGARSRGFGGGRGWRNMFHATGLPGWMRFGAAGANSEPRSEKKVLQNQAEALQAQLDIIKKRLGELEEGS